MAKSNRSHIPDSVRQAVLTQAGYRCAVPICQNTLALHLHHIIPVCDGGPDTEDNLLALCGYCHDLYHREIYPLDAIKKWKARLITLNNPGADTFQFVQRLNQLEAKLAIIASSDVEPDEMNEASGFARASGQFYRRTCAIGFCHGLGLRLFVQTGYGTFIDEREIVTAGRALEIATDVAHARNGVAAVMHPTCASRFVVKGRFRWGDIALLEQAEPIDSDFTISDEVLMTARVPKQRANLSPRCLLGQNLAFFHAPEAHASFRETMGYQLETATVSFQRHDRHAVYSDFALTHVQSRIEHVGAGVFTSTGRLVGVLTDVLVVKTTDTTFTRHPILSTFTGIPVVGGKFDWDKHFAEEALR